MAFNLGAFFSSGVKEIGEGFKAKDAEVRAEAKASAEAFIEAQESYENEITGNRNVLKKNAKSLQALGINDVGKIRTIINAYGGKDTLNELQKDFTSYQSDTILGQNSGQFKTLKEYINGKISGTGNTFVSDEAAEQAQDEAAIAGDELDIQQAEKKAKGMGVSLEQYLNTQARKLSSRPAFSVEGKAARLVEESKVGAFGKTLTMEKAKKMVTGGQELGGAGKQEDLGDTGFALEREGGMGSRELSKILSEANQLNLSSGKVNSETELRPLRNDILNNLPDELTTLIGNTTNRKIKNINSDSVTAVIAAIDTKLRATTDRKTIGMLNQLKKEYQGKTDKSKAKPNAKHIEYLKNNPSTREKYIEKFGIENLPSELKKEIKDDNPYDSSTKTERVIDSEGNAPPKPPSSFLTKPKEKKAREEWDKLYGADFYPNGKPKPKQK